MGSRFSAFDLHTHEAPRPGLALTGDRGPLGCRAEVGTHPLRLLVWEDARRPSGCEVAVDFKGVPGAPLVGIDPVFTWISETGGDA